MEAGNQSNGASANEAIPCGKRLEGRPPGRGVATDALGLHTSMETEKQSVAHAIRPETVLRF